MNCVHKYAALNHTDIFIGVFIVLPLLLVIGDILFAILPSTSSNGLLAGSGVLTALCGIIWFRPLLAATFQRVYLTDYGIEVRLFSKTVASIQWRDCRSVFPCYLGTTGDLYNHYWTCFSTTQADTTKFSNLGSRGLMVIPKQTNECIYMNRSEFSYAFIKKNVSDAVWKAYVRYLEREKKQYTNEDILDASNDYTVRHSAVHYAFRNYTYCQNASNRRSFLIECAPYDNRASVGNTAHDSLAVSVVCSEG